MKQLLSLIPGARVLAGAWSFLTSTLGIVLVVAVLAFVSGYRLSDRKAEIERLQSEVKTLRTDVSVARGAKALADKQQVSLEAYLKTNQEKVDALQAKLAKPPGARCRTLTRDAAERLSDIR